MDSLRRLALTPLLIGIHAVYLVSDALEASGTSYSASRTQPLQQDGKLRAKKPKHVAFSIVSSTGHSSRTRCRTRSTSSSTTRCGSDTVTQTRDLGSQEPRSKSKPRRRKSLGQQEQLLLHCVKEAVTWAMNNEVDEISLWNEEGLLQEISTELLDLLVPSPPTPPFSDSCSHTNHLTASSSTSNSPSASSTRSSVDNLGRPAGGHVVDEKMLRDGESLQTLNVQSYTVWPNMEEMLNVGIGVGAMRLKPLSVHILPATSSEDMLAQITQNLVGQASVALEDIDVELIDGLVKDVLHFQNDPDLLIVHQLPGSGVRKAGSRGAQADSPVSNDDVSWSYRALRYLLHPDPLEIHGYPFWTLRLTEIYHSASDDMDCTKSSSGRSETRPTTASWDEALGRWRGVEQRLGR